ncbi:hypothetical protein CQZ93_16135 [Ochrobactrum vermis]|nr:hypothetical protein CQZ93_16135 [Ochrobactrum vermis]
MSIKSIIIEFDAQISKLHERKELLIVKSADRFAHAATKTRLTGSKIIDEEVDTRLEEITARFRETERSSFGGTAYPRRGEPDCDAGAAAKIPHGGGPETGSAKEIHARGNCRSCRIVGGRSDLPFGRTAGTGEIISRHVRISALTLYWRNCFPS